MNFVSPLVLYLIPVLIPVIAWFLWWTWRKRQTLIRQFVSERLLSQLLEGVSPTRQKIRLVLIATSILFLLLALARPQWGFVWEEASQRGRDILVAIDTSKSMLATDMSPNRLTRAKLAALDLLRLAKNDRLGLIAFAGGAFLQSPLTLDDEAFRQNINALDTSIIPQGGTSLAEAIDTAVSSFASEEGDNHHVLVIFTDGEDQDQGAIQAAEKAVTKNLKIFTVGVGTPAGELIRVEDQNGKSSFIKDASGNAVKSRLNEDLLRQIATTGNGFYLALREGNAMQTLYQKGLEPLPTSEISSKMVRHLNEQFHWPLGIAIALLLTEMLLPAAPKKRTSAKSVSTAAAVALLLIFFTLPADASPARAYKDYRSGKYKDARNEYERLLEKKPDNPVLNYNAGAAAYRSGEYDAAAKQFSAAARAKDLELQEKAYYNLGNSNYRLGNGEIDPKKKMALWHEAVQNFESSLKLNPKDNDAAFNRDLVKKRLEELQKQQQQENKDQNKDENKDKQDNKDNQQKDQKQDKNDQQKKQDNSDSKKDDQQKQDQKDNEQQKSEQQKKDEEKKQQEQQQQQQQQDQKKEGNEKKDSQEKGNQEQANKDEADPQKEAEQEARAAQLGQMTPKQAQQVLDAQKSEERALIYRQPMERRKAREKALNDW
jgi:Ca-activated chloride channel homolog